MQLGRVPPIHAKDMGQHTPITPPACRICGADATHAERLRVRETQLGLPGEFEYFICPDCACLQITQIPADLSPYYPGGYYSFRRPDSGGLRQAVKRVRFALSREYYTLGSRLAAVLLNENGARALHAMGITRGQRILDVGCGAGSLLYKLRECGFAYATGCDPFLPGDLRYGNGLIIRKTHLAEMDGEYDVVMLHHSLEHMPDQAACLREAAARLAPEGRLLVRIPVSDSEAFRTYREHWFSLDAPRHFYLHTRKSFGRLLAQTGFELEFSFCDSSFWQFASSELCRRGILSAQGLRWLLPRLPLLALNGQMAAWLYRTARVNRELAGDNAAFVARKARASLPRAW